MKERKIFFSPHTIQERGSGNGAMSLPNMASFLVVVSLMYDVQSHERVRYFCSELSLVSHLDLESCDERNPINRKCRMTDQKGQPCLDKDHPELSRVA